MKYHNKYHLDYSCFLSSTSKFSLFQSGDTFFSFVPNVFSIYDSNGFSFSTIFSLVLAGLVGLTGFVGFYFVCFVSSSFGLLFSLFSLLSMTQFFSYFSFSSFTDFSYLSSTFFCSFAFFTLLFLLPFLFARDVFDYFFDRKTFYGYDLQFNIDFALA